MTALAMVDLEPLDVSALRCHCRACRRTRSAVTLLLPFADPKVLLGPARPRIDPPGLAIVVPPAPASQVREITFAKVFRALRKAGICGDSAVANSTWGLEELDEEELARARRACFIAGHVPGRAPMAVPVRTKRPTGTGRDDLIDKEVGGLKVLEYLGKSERNRTLFKVECVFCGGHSEREGRNIIKSRPDGCGKCPGSKRRTTT